MFDYSSIFVTKKNKELTKYLKLLINAAYLDSADFVKYLFEVMPHDKPLLVSVMPGDTIALSIVMDTNTMDIGAVHVMVGHSGPIQLASITIYSKMVYTENMTLNMGVLFDIFSQGATVKHDNVQFFCGFSWLKGMILFDGERIFTPILNKLSNIFNSSFEWVSDIALYILVTKHKSYAELLFKKCYAMLSWYGSELLEGNRELKLRHNSFSTIGTGSVWFDIKIEEDAMSIKDITVPDNIFQCAGHHIVDAIESSSEYNKQTGVDIQLYKEKYNLDTSSTQSKVQWVSMDKEYVVNCNLYDVLLYLTICNPMKQVQILLPPDKKSTHLLFNRLHGRVFGLKEQFARKQTEYNKYIKELSIKFIDKTIG